MGAVITRGGFLLREPDRPDGVAVAAAIVGAIPRPRPQGVPMLGAGEVVAPTNGTAAGQVLSTGPRAQGASSDGSPVDFKAVQGGSFGQIISARPDGTPLGTFLSPKLVKGRITNEVTRQSREFMFNPTQIDKDNFWDWGEHKIPGSSHPVISGGTGGARIIKFSLFLDADRGRSHRRPGVGRPATELGDTSLDLTLDIRWYEEFTYPQARRGNDGQLKGPATAIFSMGPMFPGVRVVFFKANPRIVEWTPRMEPKKCFIDLELREVVSKSRSARDFAVNGVAAEPPVTIDNVTGRFLDNGAR